MTTLADFQLTDLSDDHLAGDLDPIRSGSLRTEYSNTETLSATKELADGDTQLQILDGGAADRDVELAPEASTNHVTVIFNDGSTNDLVVKDDSGGTTFITLTPGDWAMFLSDGTAWRMVEGRETLKTYFDTLYASGGDVSEYQISATVATNNLTVALKDKNGNDPSSGTSVKQKIGGTVRSVAAALSMTINAGTDTFNLGDPMFAAQKQQLFVYLGYNTSGAAVFLGLCRKPGIKVYGDASSTATDEDYMAIDSGSPASTDPVQVIGRIDVQNSGTASYNWSIPSGAVVIHRPIYFTDPLTWKPQFTNLSVGDGTLTGQYMVADNRCYYNWGLVWGSSTSISGAITFTLPFIRKDFYGGSANLSNAFAKLTDATGGASGNYAGIAQVADNAGTGNILCQTASGTYLYLTTLSSTVPFTWTTSDEMSVDNGMYFID